MVGKEPTAAPINKQTLTNKADPNTFIGPGLVNFVSSLGTGATYTSASSVLH